MATCRVWTYRDTSRQIDANPNSISFRGWRRPLRVLAEIYVCKVHVARWGRRRGTVPRQQSAGFSRGRRPGASLWERRREEERIRRERKSAREHHSISGQGSATGCERERGEGPVGLMHPFSWIIALRSYDFLRPSRRYFPSFSTTFSRLRPPPFSNNVKCIVCLRSYLQRRQLSSYFTEHPLQGRVLLAL